MNSEDQRQKENPNEWIPLSHAAQFTPYSADYLSLLARKRRLTAKKIDGIWYTTRGVLQNYLTQQAKRAEALNQNPDNYRPFLTGENSSVETAEPQQLDPMQIRYARTYADDVEQVRGFTANVAATTPAPQEEKSEVAEFAKVAPAAVMPPVLVPRSTKIEPAPAVPAMPEAQVSAPRAAAPLSSLPAMGKLRKDAAVSSEHPLSAHYESEVDSRTKITVEKATKHTNSGDALMEEFMLRFNAHIDRQVDSQHGPLFGLLKFIRRSYRHTVFSAKFPAFLVCLILIVILPLRFVSGFADNFFQGTVDAVKNAQTVMGFRPGTHENEILLLGPEGEIAIFGNVETEGQFRSYVEDGIAPIIVESTTKVENLNADMLDGVSGHEFTLAYVTKNGNVTYEPVFLEGTVEIGQTLLVRGATKLLNSLQVDGNLSVFGDADFAKGLSVSGPAVFKDMITAPNVIVSDLLRAHRLVVEEESTFESSVTIEDDLLVRGGMTASSGRINGNFAVEETFRANGDVYLGDDGFVVVVESEDWSVDEDGLAVFAGLDVNGDTSLSNLDVSGGATFGGAVNLNGSLNDANGSAGTAGYVLQSTGTSTIWVATSSLGIIGGGGGSGILQLNGQTGGAQSFATGTATGIGLTITSAGDVHTFTPTVSAGYSIPLTASTTEWATAYSWGNHATAGYLTNISGSSIEDLSDVSAMTEAAGDLLYWNGTSWSNIATSSLGLQAAGNYFNKTTDDTDDITEGSANLFFTDARSRNSISEIVPGLDYATSTGVISLTSGYNIPLTASTTAWNDATNIVNASSTYWNQAYASTTALTPAYIRGLFSNSATGLTYNSSTGATSLTAGYVIPLSASTTEWANFYATPSTRITAGANLAWSGNTLVGTFGTSSARASISETVTGLDYSNSTGVLSTTSGYSIPLTASTTEWATAYSWGNHSLAGYLTAASIDTSAEIAAIVTDETGTGSLVFSNAPTFTGNTTLANASTTNISVSGNAYVSGQTTLATASSTALTVSGRSYLQNASTTGLTASGATFLGSTLSVSGAASLSSTLGVTGQTTLANASTTNLTVSTNSYLGTVRSGTWNGTDIDVSDYTNLAVTATGLTLNNDTIELTSGYSIPLTASTTEWSSAYASTTALTPAYIRGLFSNSATGLTYNSSTGATSLTAGYVIPLSASTTEWANFYATPSTRITAGANLAWSGNTLVGTFGTSSARASISETVTGLDYSNSTGVLSTTSGYSIPLTASTTEWATAYSWGNHSLAGYLTAASIDTSAEIAAIVTDETGTGSLVFSNAPTFTGNTTLANASTTNISVSGNAYVSGQTTLATASSTALTVSGRSYLQNASTTGLTASGATFLGSTLSVSGAASLSSTLGVTGQTTLANASTTNLTVSTNSYLGTVRSGTWNGTDIDVSDYTNLAVTATGLTLNNDTIELTSGYSIPLTASTTEWSSAYASTTALTPAYIRGLFSNSATGLTYNSSTGATSLTAGYVIPLSASTTEWANFYATPSTRITAGANLAWSGNTLVGTFGTSSARASISETVTGLDYSNSTGVLSTTSGYSIPLTASTTEWATAYSWGNHSLAGYLTAASIDTSAEIAAIVTDETGTGSLVFSNAPTFTGNTTLANASTTNISVSGNAYVSGQTTLATASSTALTVSGRSYLQNASTTGLTASGATFLGSTLSVSGAASLSSTLGVTGQTTLANASTTNLTVSTNSYLGTVRSGTWNGSTVGVPYGGTGATSLTGIVIGNGTSAMTATTTLAQSYGGTGNSSYTAGDILYANGSGQLTRLPIGTSGQVLKVSAGLPSWGLDLTSGGGGGGGGVWSTSTDLIYPSNPSNIVVVGNNATSTLNSIFEVTGSAYISSNVGIGDTSPVALLTVGSGDAFQVNSSGAIAAAAGITSSGSITFSGLTNGILRVNGSGVVSTTTVDISGDTNLAVTATGLTLNNDTIELTSGYSIPLTASTTEWATAYSWGNHSLAGYLTAASIDTSAEIAAIVTDETGTGSLVFSNAPTFTGNTTLANASTTNISVSGNAYVSGQTTLATASSTALTVSGRSYLQNASTTGLTASGATFLGSTLSVSGAASLSSTLGVTGQTTLANASTTNLTVSTNSYLGTVRSGTWNGTDIDVSDYTNLAVTATGLTLNNDTIELTSGYSIPLTASTTEWSSAYASTTALTPAYIRGLFSNSATGLTYNSSTGATSLTAGYVIPLSASTTEWANFYATPSTRITAGANLAWSGNTLVGTFGTSSARASISETVTGLDYSNSTGVLSTTSGYSIPLTASTTEWATAYSWGNHSLAGYLTAASIDTSAEIAAIVTDETGTGSLVFSNAPTFTGNTTLANASTTNISVSGNAYVSGQTTLATASSTALTVSGRSYLQNASTTGLTASGATFLGSTLSVSGAASLSSTLGVTGQTTLANASTTNLTVSTNSYLGTVRSGTWNGSTIGEIYGGTGQTTYASGDMLYASGANTLAKRTIGATGQILSVSGGLPTWTSTSTLGIVTTSDIDTCAEFAAIMTGETGTCGSLVLSVSPTFTGNTTLANASTTNLTNSGASYFGGMMNMTGSAANIILGSNYLSGDGGDEGINIDSSGSVGVNKVAASGYEMDIQALSGNADFILRGTGGSGTFQINQLTGSYAQLVSSGNLILQPSSGNVGIGTTTPSQALTVVGSVDASVQFLGQAADTVSAPSFSWTGDTNVGMYRPTTDTLGLVTAGVERLRVDSSGNVGIGDSSPTAFLTINNNHHVYSNSEAIVSDGAGSTDSIYLGRFGAGVHTLRIYYQGHTGYNSAYVTITKDWDAGTPDDGIYISSIEKSVGAAEITSFHHEYVDTDETDVFLLFTHAAPATSGISVEWSVVSSSYVGVTDAGTTPPALSSSNAIGTRFAINYDGNVGVGTTTPGSLLTVSGTANISGATTLDSTLSVAGQTTLTSASSTYLTVADNSYFNGAIVNDHSNATYDVWIQGTAISTTGDTRNLALLGNASTDDLILNYNTEYDCVSVGGTSCTAALDVTGTIAASGAITEAGSAVLSAADFDTCAEIAAIVTGETGTCGSLVLSVSPTFTGNTTLANASTTNLGVSGNAYFASGIWNSSGNVGIGTTNPGAELHVESASGLAAIFGSNAFTDHYIQVRNGGSGSVYFGLDADLGAGGSALIQGGTSKGIGFAVNSDTFGATTTMFISSAGNVGIGTTTPTHKLAVYGDAVVGQDGGNLWIGALGDQIRVDADGSSGYLSYNGGSKAIDFDEDEVWLNDNDVYIGSAGVGIGNVAPDAQHLLDVTGSILAENGASSSTSTRNAGFHMWTDEAFGMELHYNGTSYSTALFGRASDTDAVRFGTYAANATAQGAFNQLMVLTTAGRLGIGTTTPGSLLSVAGTAHITGHSILATASSTALTVSGRSYLQNASTTGLTASGATFLGSTLSVSGAASLSSTLGVTGQTTLANASTTNLGVSGNAYFASGIWNSSGNVGIGTTSPTSLVSIEGTHLTSKIHLKAENAANPDSNLFLWASEPGLTYEGAGISNNWRYSGSWARESTTDGGSYMRLLEDSIGLNVVNSSGTDTRALTIISGGNVGIGTTSPSHLFTVAGDTNQTGALRFNGSAGTANQILVSNGSSAPSWTSTSTLGIVTTSDIDTCAEFAAIMTGETGTCGSLVLSVSPTFTGNTTLANASTTNLTNSGASYFGGMMNMTGSAANIILGSNYLSGDGGDEGISVNSSGNVTVSGTLTTGSTISRELSTSGLFLYGGAADGANIELYGGSHASLAGRGYYDATVHVFRDSDGSPTMFTVDSTNQNSYFTTGSVGIGTSTPVSKLAVVQTGGTSGTSTALTLTAGNGLSYFGNNQITFGYSGSAAYQHAIKSRHSGGTEAGNAMDFYVWDQGTDAVGAVGTKQVLTLDGNGHVGVGVTSPATTLHISSSTTLSLRLENQDTDILTNEVVGSLEFYANDASANGTGIVGTVSSIAENAGNYYGLQFSTYDNASGLLERMRITRAGHVGIGTSTPAARLHVVSTTTDQLRLGYDHANYWTDAIEADGGRTMTAFGSDGDLDISFYGATDGDFSINGDDLFVDTNTGHVGIGDSSPASMFTVGDGGDYFRVQSDGSIIQDMSSGTFDVWIQGATGGSGDTRNLALLGNASTDDLILNYNTEYDCVSVGGTSCTAALDVTGTIAASGAITEAGSAVLSAADFDTCAEIAAIVTGETGTCGSLVLSVSPTFTGNTTLANASTTNLGVSGNAYFASGIWNSSGNVGIGTVSPLAKLHVGPTISDYASLSFATTSAVIAAASGDQDDAESNILTLMRDGTSGVIYAGAARFDMSRYEVSSVAPRTQLDIKLAHDTTADVRSVLTLQSGGNVGIGTTNPQAKLEVGTDNSDNALRLSVGPSPDGSQAIGLLNKVEFLFRKNRTLGQLPGGYVASRSTGDYFASVAQQQSALDFATAASGTDVVRMTIDTSGNVGIGTTSPSHLFTVAGDTNQTGALRFNGSAGTANQILVSNGSSAPSWTSTSTLGIVTTSDIDTCAEFAAIMTGETGTCGSLVLSVSPTFTGNTTLANASTTNLTNSGASYFGGMMNMTGSAANIILGSNYLSGDGGDEGINIDSSGSVGVNKVAASGYEMDIQALSGNADFILRGTGGSGTFQINQLTGSYAQLVSSGNLILQPSSGNVGIGTTTPSQALTVVGSVDASVQFLGQAADTVSAPSFSWTGDTNVGMYRPTTDTLGLVTAGVERLRVDSSGNVGIGTSTPGSFLDVTQTFTGTGLSEMARFVHNRGDIGDTDDGSYLSFQITDSNNSGGTYDHARISWRNNGTGADENEGELAFWTANNGVTTEQMTITSSGSVGIGTTTPASQLTVQGSNTAAMRLLGTAGGTEIGDIYVGSAGQLVLSTAATGDTSPFIEMDAEDDQFGFILRDSGTGSSVYSNFYMNDAATDYLNINVGTTNATAGLVLQTGGNVGIGTTTPGDILVVQTAGNSFGKIRTAPGSGASGNLQLFRNASDANSVDAINIDTTTGEVFTIDYSGGAYFKGNVGIGTTSPGYKFAVNLGQNSNAVYDLASFHVDDDAAAGSELRIIGNRDLTGTNRYAGLQVYDGSATVRSLVLNPSGGNVGIGTTTPISKLSISETTTNALPLIIEGTIPTSSAYTGMSFYRTAEGEIGRIVAVAETVAGRRGLGFYTDDNTSVAERVRISGDGNVGIGTTTPESLLHVYTNGSQIATKLAVIEQSGSGDAHQMFTLSNGASYVMGIDNSDSDSFKITYGSNENATLGSGDIFVINTSGNVGIGTTSPSHKLTVNGQVLAQSFHSTSTTATSTFAGAVGIGLTTPQSMLHVEAFSAASDVELLTIDNSGTGNGTAATVQFKLGGGTYAAIQNYYSTGSYLGLRSSGSTNHIVIDPSGNVGIGDSTPSQKLEVVTSADRSLTVSGAVSSVVYLTGTNPAATNTLRGIGLAGSDITLAVGSSAGTTTTAALTINTTGGVGIGDTTPTEAALVVGSAGAGNIYLTLDTAGTTNNAVCWDNAGATLLYDCDATPADYAESYPTTEGVTYGEIVMTTNEMVLQTDGTYVPRLTRAVRGQGTVLGITSDNYHDFTSAGQDLIEANDNPVPVALNGRVPVKVNLEGGSIKVGDPVMLSSVAGTAAKADGTGVQIGIALEEFDEDSNTDKILVFVQNGNTLSQKDLLRFSLFSMDLSAGTSTFELLAEEDEGDTIWTRLTALAGSFVDGVLKLASAEIEYVKAAKVETEELCVGSVCVDEDTFLQMVEMSGGAVHAMEHDPAPENEGGEETQPEESGEETNEPAGEEGSDSESSQEESESESGESESGGEDESNATDSSSEESGGDGSGSESGGDEASGEEEGGSDV